MNTDKHGWKCAAGFLLAGLLVFGGCASNPVTVDVDKAYAAYISQERTYEPLRIRTKPGSSVTIIGEVDISMGSPLQPLSLRSADPSTAQAAIAAGERMVKALTLGYFGYRAVDSLSASRDPVVVEQPAPVIVQPAFAPAP
jgi:hypothetical protein